MPRAATSGCANRRTRRRLLDYTPLSSPLCGVDRVGLLWGSLCHPVERKASRFITSTRAARRSSTPAGAAPAAGPSCAGPAPAATPGSRRAPRRYPGS
jgi:hypothetical protein